MAIFATFSFYALQTRKISFTILQKEKTPFQAIKTRSWKSRKIEIFPKGVNPWFWSKNGHFPNFFFLGYISQENVFYDILKQKIAFLGYKNKKFKMSKICDFLLKRLTHSFEPKVAISTVFFQALQKKKIYFTIIQNKNAPFKAIKTKSLKGRKLPIFCQSGKPMVLVQKWPFFKLFLVQENVFHDILERKTLFQAIKTRSWKSWKIEIFSKG